MAVCAFKKPTKVGITSSDVYITSCSFILQILKYVQNATGFTEISYLCWNLKKKSIESTNKSEFTYKIYNNYK